MRKKSGSKNRWLKLRASDLNQKKCYDIKLPNGKEFVGCTVEIRTEPCEGKGADERGTHYSAFFHHEGLTIELEPVHLVRVNKSATADRMKKEKRRENREELETLLEQRKNLDAKIARLRKRKGK